MLAACVPYSVRTLDFRQAFLAGQPASALVYLEEQRSSKRMFGEIALRHQYLSQEKLYSLLAIQRERPEGLAQSLVQREILPEAEVGKQLKAYYHQVLRLK